MFTGVHITPNIQLFILRNRMLIAEYSLVKDSQELKKPIS